MKRILINFFSALFFLNAYSQNPSITNQPVNTSVCTSSNTSFSVTATGVITAYNWQVSIDNGLTYNTITIAGSNPTYSGWTTPTLILNGVTNSNNGNLYRCIIWGQDTSITETFTTPGSGNWVCPANITSVTVECWGGGGGSGAIMSFGWGSSSGGGGGGAYARLVATVTPGSSYPIIVGAGGTGGIYTYPTTATYGNNGGTTKFNSTTIISVGGEGSASCINGLGNGAVGGSSTSCIGTFKFSGGTGATASRYTIGSSVIYSGGGGGGSGGSITTGGNGSTTIGGTGGILGGGNGGNSNTTGSTPGGGGGGSSLNSSIIGSWNGINGKAGGSGKIALMYSKNFNVISNSALLTIINNSTNSITQTSCDSFLLNGIIYTSSGIYTQHLINNEGCDSIITLNLTIASCIKSITKYGESNTNNSDFVNKNGKTGSIRSLTKNGEILSSIKIITSNVSSITQTTASCGGDVISDGGSIILSRGVCWSTSQYPTIALSTKTTDGIGVGSFNSSITGLLAGTIYYIRAYATNSFGTIYGNQISFTTTGSMLNVTDIDGNVYDTVKIGSQIWLKQNLKTTHFQNGNIISNITNNTSWSALTTGAYIDYNDNLTISTTYGRLYNWYAVVDSRNLCPIGWHIPNYTDWSILAAYLGGASIAGGKLKEIGTTHWNTPNTGANNSSGFTALPSGYRNANGAFDYIYFGGTWWCSTEGSSINAWSWSMDFNLTDVRNYNGDKKFGFSIRCIRDE